MTVIGIDLGTTNSCVAIMDGKSPKVIENVEKNTTIEFDINNSVSIENSTSEEINKYFESESIVEHKHVENIYNDYEKEVLLPHENSRLGPGIASGDVNGDGLEDFIVGGAKDQKTALFIQNSRGSFNKLEKAFPESHKDYEDMDMILEDFEDGRFF